MAKKALFPLVLFCVIVSVSLLLPATVTVASPMGGAGDDPPAKKPSETKKTGGKKDTKSTKDKTSKKGKKDKNRKPKKDSFPKGDHEKKFREALGEEYKVKYKDHFVVFSNADDDLIKSFIHRLEPTFNSVYKLCERTGVKIKRPKEKLVVIYCKTWEDYNSTCILFTGQAVPPDAAGLYYRFPYNFSLFYDNTTSAEMRQYVEKVEQLQREARAAQDRNEARAKSKEAQWYRNKIDGIQEKTNREVVQHELAHQCLFNFGFHTLEARNPIWLSEGMATQFETPPGKSGAGLGAINQSRLGMLRDIIDQGAPNLRDFVMRMEVSPSIELPEYAISWGFMNYLLKKHKKQFPDFVKEVAERSMEDSYTPMGDIKLFEKHFGPLDDGFQRRWERYIKSMPYRKEN